MVTSRDVKTILLTKLVTVCENRFLRVIGLRDVMYHMAVSSQKAAGSEVKCSYVISRLCPPSV